MTVVIDYREKSLPKYLQKIEDMGIPMKIGKLPAGDILIADRLLIERKDSYDLYRSVVDGRFFDQLKRLKDAAECSALCIEGSIATPIVKHWTKVPKEAVLGAMASALTKFQVPIISLPSRYWTVDFIIAADRVLSKKSIGIPKVCFKKKSASVREQALTIVQSFPGVGQKVSVRLLEKFHSIENIVNASVEELAEVEGLGRKRAERLKEVFTHDFGN